jgi:hypothetical protein
VTKLVAATAVLLFLNLWLVPLWMSIPTSVVFVACVLRIVWGELS